MQILNPSAVGPEFCVFHQASWDAGAVVLDHMLSGGKVKGWCCLNSCMASATPSPDALLFLESLRSAGSLPSPPPPSSTPTELLLRTRASFLGKSMYEKDEP